jgi:hypothetical protein
MDEPSAPWLNVRAGLVVAALMVTPAIVLVLTSGAVRNEGSTAAPATPSPEPVATAKSVAVQACAVTSSNSEERPVDVDDDGCTDTVVAAQGRIELQTETGQILFEVGDRDDQIVIGDWDCNGSATPLVYRPSTGMIYQYDHWPSETEPASPRVSTGIADGSAVRVPDGACDNIRVDES